MCVDLRTNLPLYEGEILGWGKMNRERRKRASILAWAPAPLFVHMVPLYEPEKSVPSSSHMTFIFQKIIMYKSVHGVCNVERTPFDVTPLYSV